MMTLCVFGEVSITLEASSDSITVNNGTVTVTPIVSGNDEEKAEIEWDISNVNALISFNEDGSATLTGQINGSVTLTAYLADNSAVSASKTITISGQPNRAPEKIIKYVSYGNSYHWHKEAPSLGWYGNYGMAASSADKDYVHQLIAHLKSRYGENNVEHKYNIYSADTGTANFETSIINLPDDYDYSEMLSGIKTFIKNEQPDIVTIQYGENSGAVTVAQYQNAISQFVETVLDASPNTVVLITNPHWNANIKEAVYNAATELDIPYVDFSFINGKAEYFAYSSSFTNAGVKAHPGDKGMKWIADQMYSALGPYLTNAVDAKLSYTDLPTTVEWVASEDEITAENGKIHLDAKVIPESASQDVIFTSSNENIAIVDNSGVVTALNNGTVTVKAMSAYDSNVYVELDITVSGQSPAYSVTYDKNTDDNVSGMPENFDYAKGVYTFSDALPERDKYVFNGWSLSPDGEIVTEAEISADTTVYAVWETAYMWNFDRLGYQERFTVENGFNEYVMDGKFMTIATGTDEESGNILKIISPELELDGYDRLEISMRNTEISESTKLILTLETKTSKYTFSKAVDSTDFVTYKFDLSDINDTIIGFSVVPTDIDCTIYIDSIEFIPMTGGYIKEASYSITKYGDLKASFYVKSAVVSSAVVSAFDDDGRLLAARVIPMASGWCCAEFSDYEEIDYVKVNLFGRFTGLSPLCEQVLIYNTTENGEVDIPMFPIFG